MDNGNLIFFGSAAISIPFLEQLEKQYDIPFVVTTPDAVGGRHCRVLETPLKCYALEKGYKVIQPASLKDEEFIEKVTEANPISIVVVSYGKWIPASLHRIPRFRTINVHFSLLPRYRGAAPVQRAIENGEAETGITIFEIAREIDAGEIWSQMTVKIDDRDTSESLFQKMSKLGAPFLMKTLDQMLAGTIEKKPQDHSAATYAPPLNRSESVIDWCRQSSVLFNQFRAFTPWPGLNFFIPGKMIKVIQAFVSKMHHSGRNGEILSLTPEGMSVACGNQSVLTIAEIQPPGKRPMRPYDYCLGNCFPAILP